MLVWRKLHVLAYHNHSSASCAYETKYWTDLENDAIFFFANKKSIPEEIEEQSANITKRSMVLRL